MTKNYFTRKDVDEGIYAEVDRILHLCQSYDIMEPMDGEIYDENDPKSRTQYTKSFDHFRQYVFKPIIEEHGKELLSDATTDFDLFHMMVAFYVSANQIAKQRGGPANGFSISDVLRRITVLPDKTLDDISDMTRAIAGISIASYDRHYQIDNKILEKMIDLEIIKRHGELTADFKEYLVDYCKDAKKTMSELGLGDDPNDSRNNGEMVSLIVGFIGMSLKEFKRICRQKRRLNERMDLDQMAIVVKQCLAKKRI